MLTRSAPTADDAAKNDDTNDQKDVQGDAGLMDLDQRIAALMQNMLRLKFYAVLSQPSPTPEKLKPLLPAHLEYMISLEKRGVLFASGPLSDGRPGPPNGAGLTILRAASADEARALAEADPFVANGVRTFELKEWTVMEGSLGLKINLSDRSIEVA
jgi:uncharacterized protein